MARRTKPTIDDEQIGKLLEGREHSNALCRNKNRGVKMKILKTIAIALIVTGCTAEPEAFRLSCADAGGRVVGDIVSIDTAKKEFKQLSGSGWNLPILDIVKTETEIKLTLDATPIREALAKNDGNEGHLEGITYVAQ